MKEIVNTMRVRITLIEPLLGTVPNNPEVYRDYIGSKAENAASVEEEVAALGADLVVEKGMTVFPRNEEGKPIIWDYQIKGFFKDTCGIMRKIPGTRSSAVKAFKKEIDGLIFPNPRQIVINTDQPISTCQRPLRASTPQGERVSLAISEEIPAGATIDVDIDYLLPGQDLLIEEWLNYGYLRGLGQWRNSGKGRFSWAYRE